MLRNLPPIITNTFTETLRQPIYGIIIGATILLFIFSPSLVMYTLDDDNLLLQDVGLSTLLVAGLLLAVFAAVGTVTEEIENKTVLTVVSKTVRRSVFIIGKFLGIAAAVLLAMYLLSLTLLFVIRQGVMQAAYNKADYVVIILGSIALGVTLIVSLAANYLYSLRFGSTAVVLWSILATILAGVLFFIDKDWHYNPQPQNLHFQMAGPILLTVIAVLVLTSIAVAAATRLNMVTTLLVCTIFFLLGTSLPFWLGPVIARGGVWQYVGQAALAIVPNVNHFVVTNAIYAEVPVPLSYIGITSLYAILYVTAVLLFAIALFRRREIG
ncbi:MAG: hypothetical protein JW709_09435 [Sedimentisphaerales bacterium]|nr:hypothetical protein [Sedimentisphaerales bacterium]